MRAGENKTDVTGHKGTDMRWTLYCHRSSLILMENGHSLRGSLGHSTIVLVGIFRYVVPRLCSLTV